ncbi:MAG: CRISPR system precrRNA processing endoribonuclease RAMP protein Cas6 [Synergistetes bacterium]|nr:CRISPR system precrRNA processing endoribonuclease RAMP protein Cas6 [Synergistota bacterium]MCX8127324.1 CRISPR system precrRNA processing endoribonuclease RAMP protein Cas6 [Synergistota bacterium]MDW8191789.1 CRISPR system precrRNA processing endoribonuclease RAMP protein Cas6 [Synergistota bacterium]
MLRWRVYNLECVAKGNIKLGPFTSNVLRGKFGAEFKRLACIKKSFECSKCMLRFSCPYAMLFETSPSPLTKVMRKYDSAPRPFIIYFPFKKFDLTKGDRVSINLTLIGKANDYLPYFVYCFLNILNNLKLELVSLSYEGKNLYKGDKIELPSGNYSYLKFEINGDNRLFSVEVDLESPLRLIFNGEIQKEPSFSALMRNFFRRVVLLDYFHCGGGGEYPFKPVLDLLDRVNIVDHSITEGVFSRFSYRQKRKIPFYGVTGRIRYQPVNGFFLDYLKAMKELHVGKNTTFGFGKVVLKDLNIL